jgi:hypothetical protein
VNESRNVTDGKLATETHNESAVHYVSIHNISLPSNAWFPSISKRKFLQASILLPLPNAVIVTTFPCNLANSPELTPSHNCNYEEGSWAMI